MPSLEPRGSRRVVLAEPLERRVLFAFGDVAVTGRHLFYNNSAFDGHDPAPTFADVDAIATDKVALLPGGGGATFRNVSTYARGINGVMLDLFGVPPQTLTADDFEFRAGRSGPPDTWAEVAPAEIAQLPTPVFENSRYAITFRTAAVRNSWLRVTLKANADTDLALPDVFYFGNLFGDTGLTALRVNLPDYILIRAAQGMDATDITHPYDFDKDGKVTPIDLILVRQNIGESLRAFTAPAATAASVAAPAPMTRPQRRSAYDLASSIDPVLAAL